MKLYYVCMLALLLQACGGSKTNSKPFSEEKIKGVWMITYSAPADNKGRELHATSKMGTDEKEKNYELLAIYSFDGQGHFQCDSGGTEVIAGTVNLQDTLLQLKAGGGKTAISPYWSILKCGETVMTVLTEWPGEDRYMVVYDLKRLNPDTGFDITRVPWKQRLDSNATDAQLVQRLREQLTYYTGYFRTMHANKISVFAPDKVLLPVRLYGGGLGLKQPDNTMLWVKNMGGMGNAARAYAMLQQCFKVKMDFPDHGHDFTLEYADILAHLARQLPK